MNRLLSIARRAWLVATIVAVVQVLFAGTVQSLPAAPAGAETDALHQGSRDDAPPADQVQAGPTIDLGVALSAVAARLPVPDGLRPLPPAHLGEFRPGFREPVLRPPRPAV